MGGGLICVAKTHAQELGGQRKGAYFRRGLIFWQHRMAGNFHGWSIFTVLNFHGRAHIRPLYNHGTIKLILWV